VRVVFDPVPGGCCVRLEPPHISPEAEVADS
jgi:hypothetical protein